MSRRTRTLVPVTTNLLYLEVVDGVQESLQLRRQKAMSSTAMLRHYPNWTLAKMSEWLGNVRRPGNQQNASRNFQAGPTWFKLTAKRSTGTEKTLD